MSDNQERQEDKALRDHLREVVEVHQLRSPFADSEGELQCRCGQWIGRRTGGTPETIREHLADAVLPVVQAHQEALREALDKEKAKAEALQEKIDNALERHHPGPDGFCHECGWNYIPCLTTRILAPDTREARERRQAEGLST